MWVRFGFADDYGYRTKRSMDSVFLSSIALISLVQLSNVNTLLIVPVLILRKQLSQNILFCIALAIVIGNFFILNARRLYDKCVIRWKDEPKKSSMRNKRAAIIFIVLSMVMLLVSGKIVYNPHSLSIPYWGI